VHLCITYSHVICFHAIRLHTLSYAFTSYISIRFHMLSHRTLSYTSMYICNINTCAAMVS
jgi:hypothetical protein